MDTYTREQFLERLKNDWATLVERFQNLPLEDQTAYLKQQGYPNFTALLAHIIAWWQDGSEVIRAIQIDPETPHREYDIDAFNTEAVQKFATSLEAEMIRAYESQRQEMVELVYGLNDNAIQNPRINRRLFYEILGHWDEHRLE